MCNWRKFGEGSKRKCCKISDILALAIWCPYTLYEDLNSNLNFQKTSGQCNHRSDYFPRLTKLVRGLWNGFGTCVCVCVRPSVRASGLNEKCYFSVISWPILILFVLSDRAWCGLQNFYTELINYANLFKFIQNQWKMPLFRNHNRSALEAGTYITHRVNYYLFVF